MRRLWIVFFLLLPLLVIGQGRESNQYYKTGLEFYEAGQYEEAVGFLQKSDSLDNAQLKPNSPKRYRAGIALAKCWQKLAEQLDLNCNYAEAVRYETLAMDFYKKVYGESHPDYVGAVHNLAWYLDENGNYEDALKLGTVAVEIRRNALGENHPDYAKSLAKLAWYNNDNGHYDEAIRLGTIAMEIRKRLLGDNHPDYAESLSELAVYNDRISMYEEAIRLETIALDINEKNYGEQHRDIAISLNNLAFYNSHLGNYYESIKLVTRALDIYKNVLGEEHPYYAISLSNLATYHYYLGNYTDAVRVGRRTVDIRRKVLGEEHPDYAESLNNLAVFYHYVGDNSEAIRLVTLANEIYKKVLGEEHPFYATSLGNLANYNSALGNYDESIRLGTIAMGIRKKVLGEKHPKYAGTLSNLAKYHSKTGNRAEAIRLETLALEIRKNGLGEGHPLYALSLNKLADYYYETGNYARAIELETAAIDIRKKVLGEGHPDYAESLRELAYYNFYAGNYDVAENLFQQGYERTVSFILKNFSSMTYKERSIFWNLFSSSFSTKLPYAAYKHPVPTLVTLAYNGQIFSKGLLLNAELEIQKIIEQSGDSNFARRYYKIRNDRTMLDDLYKKPLEERTMDADSLFMVIENEERVLVESSKDLGDYTRNLSIDWRDVQNHLDDNDLAVEFANFKDTDGQIRYVALALKKGMSAPELVRLFGSDDFDAIETPEYYKTSRLYDIVWKPLDKYLQGVENVYFSPCGKFHTIGIEYLPSSDGKIFAKKYNTFRLSSTRELAMEHDENPDRLAATYGGIKYDFSEDNWLAIKNEKDAMMPDFQDMPLVSAVFRGDGMVYLDGTKGESEAVATLLRMADYSVSTMSGAAATEESFKALSGKGLKILHIGTHGFYESVEDMANANLSFFNSSQQSSEDKSLSCSGLLFAGANSTLDPQKAHEIPEGVEDGVLTAKEISRLDFKGLDLVVLSACQTGLGEVTSEGVFGLQRGFKKAGAQTIVMSLWKVSDEATQLLMIEFFKNLTAGQSKRAAFLAAQDTVRAKFPSPLYWAAFIMVDGN